MSTDLWFLDDIRDAVNAPESVDAELVREASISFSEACREANKRLRQVDKLLRDGLRSEAIQLADLEPSLLTLVADLDFQLLEEWQGMLAQWDMQLPPQLELDIAKRLNSAYAEIRPLEQLLRQHRLLALARAPLSARIEVLRKLNTLDELNFSWESDLVEYERLRLRQIKSEAAEATGQGDLEKLTELQEELSNSKWSCEVSSDLVKEIKQGYRSLEHNNAHQQLELLAPKLDQAYSEFDIETANAIATKWNEYAKLADLPPEDPLAQRTIEAIEWVNDQLQITAKQRDFESNLQSLEAALEHEVPKNELESLLNRTQRFDLPIPSSLVNRVQDRITTQTAHAHRRGRLIGTTAVAALTVVAVATFLYWRAQDQKETLHEHRATLSALVDESSWTLAENYFQGLPQLTRQDAKVQSLHAQIGLGTEEEQHRIQRLTVLLDEAESKPIEALDRAGLKRIKDLVRTEVEQQRLANLEFNHRKYDQEQQKARDEAFLECIKEWSEKLAALERTGVSDEAAAWLLLTQLQEDLTSYSGVTSSLRSRSGILENKLRAIIRQRVEAKDGNRLVSAVYQSTGRVALFEKALSELIRDQPKSVAAANAKQILREKEAWLSVIKWDRFWSEKRARWREHSPKSAKETFASGEELSSQTIGNDLSRAFERRKPYLKKIIARDEINLAELKYSLLQNKLVNNLWMVVDDEGIRYYCPELPQEDEHGFLQFNYYIDSSNPPKRKRLRTKDVQWHGRAPQSESAKLFKSKLAKLTESNWDETFFGIAAEIRKKLKQKPKLDTILGMDLLRRVFQTGCDGSSRFEEAFKGVIEEIDNSGIDLSVPWYLPNDSDAGAARRDAQAVVDGFEDFSARIKSTRDFYRSDCLPPSYSLTWIAVLGNESDESWECHPPLPKTASGNLVVATTSGNKMVQLTTVASVNSGTVTWNLPPGGLQPFCAPLFLRTDNASTARP